MAAITPSQVRVALITDLVDSTRLVAAIGDAAAHEWFGRHDRLARDLLARFGGLEIDKSDGFLLLFTDPAQAVGFALAYHQALRQLSVDSRQQWRARVGIQLGEVYLRENSADDIAHGAKPLEVEGLAKIIAARLMTLAQGGQTLLGPAAFDLAQSGGVTLPGHTLGWLAHGRYRIKGLDDPLAVFEVGVLGEAPLAPPPDSDKAHRDITEDERETLGWRPGPDLDVPGRPHWRLTKKLGAGGFGEVWLAEHAASGAQQVFKFCHDPERLRSLKREVTVFRLLREALGDRPDIARIIDWQFDRAPFFIESEYIPGGDLLAWADAQGGLAKAPIDERIAIAIQLADALGAAHSVGVLHKDIKPGNVLIRADGRGTPRAVLTDFGIGLVTDKTQLLAHGITVAGLTELLAPAATAGSQLYMAPELLEGKAATIQADLYALGVMLYELAAGEFKPLAPGWQRDIDCELLASDIADLVDGDPSRRPSSAAKVARDLRALPERRAQLAAERQAIADATATRLALAKSQRRRRWIGGVAAALALVSIAVGYSAMQAVQARDEAERRRGQAERLIGFMLDDFRKKLEPLGKLELLDAVGTEALNYFEQAGDETLSDEERHRRAQALYQIGEVRVQQGELEGAARALDQALVQYNALLASESQNREWLFGLGQTEFWRGMVEWRRGSPRTTLTHWQRYFGVAERLSILDPLEPRWRAEVAYGWSNIGSVQQALGQNGRALEAFQSLLGIFNDLVATYPDNIDYLAQTAIARNKISGVLRALGRPQDAIAEINNELAVRNEIMRRQPEHLPRRYEFAVALSFRARLRAWVADFDGAIPDYSVAIAALEELSIADPQNRVWARALAATKNQLAVVRLNNGDVKDLLSTINSVEDGIAEQVRNQPDYLPWRIQLAALRNTRARIMLEQSEQADALAVLTKARTDLVTGLSSAGDSQDLKKALIHNQLLRALCEIESGDSKGGQLTLMSFHKELLLDLKNDMDPEVAALLLHIERRAGTVPSEPLLKRLSETGYPQWTRLLSPRLRAIEVAALDQMRQ